MSKKHPAKKLGALPKRQRTFPHGCSLVVEPTTFRDYDPDDRKPRGGIYPFSKEGWGAALRRAKEIPKTRPLVELRCGSRSWAMASCSMREGDLGDYPDCGAVGDEW
jgi:hypothetical protein